MDSGFRRNDGGFHTSRAFSTTPQGRMRGSEGIMLHPPCSTSLDLKTNPPVPPCQGCKSDAPRRGVFQQPRLGEVRRPCGGSPFEGMVHEPPLQNFPLTAGVSFGNTSSFVGLSSSFGGFFSWFSGYFHFKAKAHLPAFAVAGHRARGGMVAKRPGLFTQTGLVNPWRLSHEEDSMTRRNSSNAILPTGAAGLTRLSQEGRAKRAGRFGARGILNRKYR